MFMQLTERAQDAHKAARKKEGGPPRVYPPWAWVQPQQVPLPVGVRPGTDRRERRGWGKVQLGKRGQWQLKPWKQRQRLGRCGHKPGMPGSELRESKEWTLP